jgi:predicted ATPase/DNA-binding CsgD family transcriptional regulator
MPITNLPLQLTSFIGRERELAEIKRLVSTFRLVTLIGAGGCGKTRLAIHVANNISSTFADGVWLVDFVPLRERGLVPQHVAQTFGLRPVPNQPLNELLLNFARPKKMLLILDNCEHLIIACVQLAQLLLPQALNLRILATSREAFTIPGEMIYQVQGLTWPSLRAKTARDSLGSLDPQDLLQYDGVHLFVDRARAISPNFTMTPDNALSIIEICRRLDGLPLALELASARVKVLTAQQIAKRLDDRFALLTSGQRTALEPHHHTLRAAIDWSYDLLTPEEQTLLRRLAVFGAGCTLDTAQTVCAGEEITRERILDLLSSLVDKSLVIAETTGRVEARYWLLETIREYALEKLEESGEAARLRDRHLDLFLTRAEESVPKLSSPYQQLWLIWLEGEHDDLRAALAWALESHRIEAGLRIANALYRFWQIRDYMEEALAWFERLFLQTDEGISLVVRANAFTYASFAAKFLGNVSAASRYGQRAVALGEAAGDGGNPIVALALGGLASSAQAVGDYQTAFDIQEQMISRLRESGGVFHLGMALIVHGGTALVVGRYDTARALLDEGLALARKAGDTHRIALAFNYFGDLARCEQNYAQAQTAYENCVALLRELGDMRNLASSLHNLGYTCLYLGDAERAYALFNESLAAHQTQQNTPGMTECLIGFAAIAVVSGLPAAGARLLASAIAIGGQQVASVWPATRMEYEHYLALARAKLTESEFQKEQVAGRALSLEQAIAYTHNLQLESCTPPATRERPDNLTVREREVTILIAEGKSNSEIAKELVLSKRTVEKHVSTILTKLGFASRTQVVRWVVEHGLTKAAK